MGENKFKRFQHLCRKLGIVTHADLDLFKRHEQIGNESILDTLERYFKEYSEVA